MAVVVFNSILCSSPPLLSSRLPSRSKLGSPKSSYFMTTSYNAIPNLPPQNNWKSPLLEFPHLSPSHRLLMQKVISAIDSRLGSQLLPSSVNPDVASFQNPNYTSEGAIDIRYGAPDSSEVDFILASWLHSALPNGGSLDIATLFAFLNRTTAAPHFLLEIIRSTSPASLVLLLDLLPRKDPVLHPDYLEAFYEKTHLDKQRQKLEKALGSNLQPFVSSSLYIRSLLSPTAVAVNIQSVDMEDLLAGEIGDVVKEVVGLWLDGFGSGQGADQMTVEEQELLVRRDRRIKTMAIEVDLSSNLPRMFGADVAERVVEEVQKAFGVSNSVP